MKSGYNYNGIKIYNDTENGLWYIYLKNGKTRIDFSTDIDAEEYIDSLAGKEEKEITIPNISERFNLYCKSLPGKCFRDGRLATTNERALKRFITSFETATGVKITYQAENVGGEWFYVIDDF